MKCRGGYYAALFFAFGCGSISLPCQGQEGVQIFSRSETRLAGALFDPLQKQPVWFDASAVDGLLVLRLDLSGQSVTLRYGQGELHVDSSKSSPQGFGTLSEQERESLRRLAARLDQEPELESAFGASTRCMIRNFSSWPADMPLFVSFDSVAKTVGGVSVPLEEIEAAHRQALDELGFESFGTEAEGSVTKTIAGLCREIGKIQPACYPTSLRPYRETCEPVLLGGTSCRGRCGTACNGLCDKQRYTQDCHDQDRCADVYGKAHANCNFLLPSTFDDCSLAPRCVDFPGVWSLRFRWGGESAGTTFVSFEPNRRFTTQDGGLGIWSATATKATITFRNGCKPVYSGALSADRLSARGTMRCTTEEGSGTWSATKTDWAVFAASDAPAGQLAPATDRGPSSARPE